MTDMYAVLGVTRDASPEAIRDAYRRLAMKHHPDRPDGSEIAFLPIQAAYDVLGDPARKQRYDQTGHTDDTTPLEVEADNRIIQMFDALLSREQWPLDPLVDMRNTAARARMETENRQHATEHQIDRLIKRADRIKRKSQQPNLYRQLVDKKIQELRQQVRMFEQEVAIFDTVLVRLADYEAIIDQSVDYTIQWERMP